ncbi:MAG: hypothetical protein ACI9VM_000829 [Candidatus Azotimanducaceae bacterium]|jgi:hypothetical protein
MQEHLILPRQKEPVLQSFSYKYSNTILLASHRQNTK